MRSQKKQYLSVAALFTESASIVNRNRNKAIYMNNYKYELKSSTSVLGHKYNKMNERNLTYKKLN